ncbi:MAG: sigma factor-like helix-turn-helix DNA-binding protein [Solirubrobacterales bacterium]
MVDELAEGRDDAARLQEALGRMRGNYREAILLRYGLGMTVPEIAEHCEISLPAAKKLVLRATAQARARMEAVAGSEACPEIREQARRLVLEKQVSGLGEDGELSVLRAHLSHCGPCRTFATALHGHLHDLGSAAVLGYASAEQFGHGGVLDGLGGWGASLLDGAQAGGGRIRTLAYKASGAFNGADGTPASALLSTGQKIAAVCTAGAATTATCLLTGAVGPGIVTSSQPDRPPAQVREEMRADQASAPVQEAPVSEPSPTTEPDPQPDRGDPGRAPAAPAPSEPVPPMPDEAETASPSSEEPRGEFGIEGSPAPSSAPVESSPAPPSSARSTGTQGSSGGGSSSPSSGAGAEPAGAGVGFHG